MKRDFLGFTPEKTIQRFVCNNDGEIFLCNLVTFSDAKDSLYAERPRDLMEDVNYPAGWWNYELTFATLQEAIECSKKCKKEKIKRAKNDIEKHRKEITNCVKLIDSLENEINHLDNSCVYMDASSNSTSIYRRRDMTMMEDIKEEKGMEFRPDILPYNVLKNRKPVKEWNKEDWKKICPEYGDGFRHMSGLYCDVCYYLFDEKKRYCPNNH